MGMALTGMERLVINIIER